MLFGLSKKCFHTHVGCSKNAQLFVRSDTQPAVLLKSPRNWSWALVWIRNGGNKNGRKMKIWNEVLIEICILTNKNRLYLWFETAFEFDKVIDVWGTTTPTTGILVWSLKEVIQLLRYIEEIKFLNDTTNSVVSNIMFRIFRFSGLLIWTQHTNTNIIC